MQEIVITAVLADAYDGPIRLLSDAQRIGYEMRGLTLERLSDGQASATMTLGVPLGADVHVIARRLGRHPGVRRVDLLDGADLAAAARAAAQRPSQVLHA